jgi:hypothetical protein
MRRLALPFGVFYRNIETALRFSKDDRDKVKVILLCRVAIGDVTYGSSHMKLPPYLPDWRRGREDGKMFFFFLMCVSCICVCFSM